MALLTRSNERLSSSIPSFIDSFFNRDWSDWNNMNFSGMNSTLPACNIIEEHDHFIIEVAAPGLKREDFKVSMVNNQLLVSCEKKSEMERSNKDYSRHEFSYETFQRAFSLPEGQIKGDNISAKYDNGILYITLPKREEVVSKPAKEIQIQ
jgi:HSP20 family protein